MLSSIEGVLADGALNVAKDIYPDDGGLFDADIITSFQCSL